MRALRLILERPAFPDALKSLDARTHKCTIEIEPASNWVKVTREGKGTILIPATSIQYVVLEEPAKPAPAVKVA